MDILEVATDLGAVTIRKQDLITITDTELRRLRMSREELNRCFAEGMELMRSRGIKPSDRIRPCAEERLDGKWQVVLVRYSGVSDPLMHGDTRRRRH